MAPLLPNPNPIMLGLGGTENAGEATDEVKGEARGIGLKGTKSWQLQSKCPVDGERTQGGVIKQEAKAVWLLAVELLEIATTLQPWRSNSTLHKWCAWNKRKEI
ncbi:hypothetical protein SESBI_42658 [Sesbania bispinosa]|nr:hypothetical protein SESBI_42658 [Sesbania bispinosa]